jgi:hypothetical protein
MLSRIHRRALAGCLALSAAACTLAGCASVSPSQYVSPRVAGRVLDLETRQPIKDAQVRRVSEEANTARDTASGGRLLEQASAVRTGVDGRFMMKSVRTLALFGNVGWYSVTLAFERAGYESVARTYTLANSTNAPSGEPIVQAGDILLPQLAK